MPLPALLHLHMSAAGAWAFKENSDYLWLACSGDLLALSWAGISLCIIYAF